MLLATQPALPRGNRLFRRVSLFLFAAIAPFLIVAGSTAMIASCTPHIGWPGGTQSAMAAPNFPLAHKGDRLAARQAGEPAIVTASLPAAPSRQTMTAPDLFAAPEATPTVFLPPPGSGRPLARFLNALADLKSGRRRTPVVVLHIGDSHVASDSFTRGIRSGLQDMFGDAGRGAVVPSAAFKYAAAANVKTSASGSWSSATAMHTDQGPFGISGIHLVSSSTSAQLTISPTDGPFDWAEVTVATGPHEGRVRLSVGSVSTVFSARSETEGAATVHLPAHGTTAVISPAGGGRTTVLWHGVGNERPGVRYVNFGLIGATAAVMNRWSDAIVKNDIAAIKPDLVVIGYGTNDGFNDNLAAKTFQNRITHLIDLVRAVSPDTEFLLIGPADGQRHGAVSQASCSTGGWSSPAKLELVRNVYRDLARQMHAGYWDWSSVMGGNCGMNSWANSGLAAHDHVHFTSKGYARSADALVKFLVSNPLYEDRVALSN